MSLDGKGGPDGDKRESPKVRSKTNTVLGISPTGSKAPKRGGSEKKTERESKSPLLEKLDRPDAAGEEPSEVFELSDSQVLLIDEATEEVSADLTVWSALKESYLSELDNLASRQMDKAIRLLYELGRIEEEVFGDSAAALSRFKKAAKTDKSPPWVLAALRRRYTISGSWPEVIETLEAEMKSASDETVRAELLERCGRINTERRRDDKGAKRCFKKSLGLDSSYQTALVSLVELHKRGKEHRREAEALHAAANATRDPDLKACLLAESGFVQLHALKDSSKAAELFALALKANPHHEGARVKLERQLYLDQRWAELIDLLVQEGDLAAQKTHNFSNRYLAATMAASRLGDKDRAIDLFEQASILEPESLLPLWELVELYGETGQWERACEALERVFNLNRRAGPPRLVASLLFQMGSIHQVRLEDRDKAKQRFRQALEVAPGDVPARRALASELRNEERWEELCDLLRVEAEVHEDPRRRAAVIIQQAEITEQRLSRPAEAIGLYDLAHRLWQRRSPAFRALDRLYTVREEWEKLYELYGREASSCGDTGRRLVLKKKMAALLEERLSRLEAAVELLEELREEAPDDRDVLMSLSRLYERLDRWPELVENLGEEAELSSDEAEKCSLICQAGAVLEDLLEDDAGALTRYEQVLDIDDGYLDALARLGRLHHRKGRWEKLVEVYTLEVGSAKSDSDAADLHYRIGQILESKMADVTAAANAYRRALEREETHVPAQQALSDLLRRAGRWEEFLDLLDRQSSQADPLRMAASNLRAGLILRDRLGKLDEATERLQAAGAAETVAPVAHLALERLYGVKGDWKALVDHLSKVEEGLEWMDPIRNGLRVVTVARHDLGDKARARRWSERVADRDGHNTEAWVGMVELARRSGGAARQAEAIQKLAEVLSDPRSSVAILKQKASWTGLKAEPDEPRPEAAVAGKILGFSPGDSEALEALERVALESGNDPALSEVCRQLLSRAAHDPATACVINIRLGDVLWRLGKIDEAAERYGKAIELNEKDLPAVRSLRVLKQLQGGQHEVAELLRKEAGLCADRQAATTALMKAGDIWLIEFLDPEKAEEAYSEVFEREPTHSVAFQRLCSLVASREGYEELAGLYKKRLTKAESRERPSLLMELAKVYRDNLKDLPSATTVLEKLRVVEPKNTAALSDLAALYGQQRRWRECADSLEKLVRLSTNKQDETARRLWLVEVLKDHLHEDEKAADVIAKVLEAEPDNRKAQKYSVELDLRLGRWDHGAEMLSKLADTAKPAERAKHLISLAEVCERGLNDTSKAQEHLIRAAALCLLAPSAIGELEGFFKERRDPAGYENLLARVLQEASADRPGSTPLRLSRARNLASKMAMPEKAEREVQQAIDQDPDSVDAHLEMASLHLLADRLGMARAEYEAAMDRDPFRQEIYRGMADVFRRQGESDRAACAVQTLVLLGEASEEEQAAAERAARAMETAPVVLGSLGPDRIAQLMSTEEEVPAARNLLKTVAPYLHEAFPQDLVSRSIRNVETMPDSHPRAEVTAHVARRLGVDRYRVLIDNDHPKGLVVAPGQTPALVLGKVLAATADPRAFAFYVGRGLCQITTGSAYLSWVDLKSLEKLLAGVVYQFDKGYGEHIAPQDELADLGKSFLKQVPRKVRRSLEEPALLFAQAGTIGMTSWREASLRAADRVGLCCSAHLAAAVTSMHNIGRDQQEVAALVRYNVSPRYAEARKMCGVTL